MDMRLRKNDKKMKSYGYEAEEEKGKKVKSYGYEVEEGK